MLGRVEFVLTEYCSYKETRQDRLTHIHRIHDLSHSGIAQVDSDDAANDPVVFLGQLASSILVAISNSLNQFLELRVLGHSKNSKDVKDESFARLSSFHGRIHDFSS